MSEEEIEEIRRQLRHGGDWCTYESDLPLFGGACDLLAEVDRLRGEANHVKIIKAMTWAQSRLSDCERTRRESRNDQSLDWAYGESVALRAMLKILETGRIPGEKLDAHLDADRAAPSTDKKPSSK